MVVFYDGRPMKQAYRRFRIKTVEGSDDFACLKEVLRRRMDKLGTDEEEKFPLPDLIVIDGGKGQLSSVAEVLAEYPYDIDVASIAKQNEEIFVTRSPEPIVLPRRDYTLRTIQRIRDEAHRFAITYHRQTHVKRNLESLLTGIEGVGKVGRRALMDKFGSIENIKRAPVEEIAATHGIGIKRAKAVKEFLNNDKDGNK